MPFCGLTGATAGRLHLCHRNANEGNEFASRSVECQLGPKVLIDTPKYLWHIQETAIGRMAVNVLGYSLEGLGGAKSCSTCRCRVPGQVLRGERLAIRRGPLDVFARLCTLARFTLASVRHVV